MDVLQRGAQRLHPVREGSAVAGPEGADTHRYLRRDPGGVDHVRFRGLLPEHLRGHALHQPGRRCHCPRDQRDGSQGGCNLGAICQIKFEFSGEGTIAVSNVEPAFWI